LYVIQYYGSGNFGLEYCSNYGRVTIGYTDRKPELDKATGRWGAPKYVVTEADVLQLIMEVHEALLHFGNFTSTYS
jgi:hypothetical protein